DRARPPPAGSAFLRGWLAGVGYFLVSLFWIAQPFYVDAKEQGWMAPFAVIFVVAGMALFWGAAGLIYRLLAGPGMLRLLWFAAALSGFEWLRGHILTGFPWDLPGETWIAGSAPSQGAALVGAYGLSLITIAAASAPGLVKDGRRGAAAALLGPLAVLTLSAWGAQRLAHAPAATANAPRIRIVQADVAQSAKYDETSFSNIVGRYLDLTARPSTPPADIIVWSEGAIPAALEDYLAPGAWTEAAIANVVRPGQTLFVGGYRFARDVRGRVVAFNSMAALARRGDGLAVTGLYDKHRLVPFGEYMPLDSLAKRLGIKQMVHVGEGFAPGPPPRPLRLTGLPPVQALICYESLFPGFTRAAAKAAGFRPAWIVNVSNDAWFGTGSGPRQHLNIASYRAIEEGVPMIRATPTGYSAVIDAFGRIVPGKMLGEGAYGVIDAALPPPLAPTLYVRMGDAPFALMLLICLAGVRWRSPRMSP
ncbi:MAG: apolipoprotein N-acyltransferase, partial [Caulobacteraceae bacterium]